VPKTENNIEIIVVVSGQSERIRVNTHQTLEHLAREALQRSGNEGQAPSEWELRDAGGGLLDQSARIDSTSIVAGTTLFLNPKAGAGGAR